MRFLLLLLFALWSQSTPADEAWLATYGPGYDVLQRFGHNAIWLRYEAGGMDHLITFGNYDGSLPERYRDLARGTMRHFGSATPPQWGFDFYFELDRSIYLQRLDLNPAQMRRLYDTLTAATTSFVTDDAQEIILEPKDYPYDFYFANCSTLLRDILDEALDGSIAASLKQQPAQQNLRDHTRRLTAQRFWLHTAFMLMQGAPADAARSAWEEAFLPEALSVVVDRMTLDGTPLVAERKILHATSSHFPPDTPPALWPRYLGLGMLSAALILMPLTFTSPRASRLSSVLRLLPLRLWLIANGLAGLFLLFLLFGSMHQITAQNWMLLLLNPLWLGLLWRRRAPLWWALLITTIIGTILLVWPGGVQFRLDQVAWLMPANLVALWAVARVSRAETRHVTPNERNRV